jgi:hypothetical protein
MHLPVSVIPSAKRSDLDVDLFSVGTSVLTESAAHWAIIAASPVFPRLTRTRESFPRRKITTMAPRADNRTVRRRMVMHGMMEIVTRTRRSTSQLGDVVANVEV